MYDSSDYAYISNCHNKQNEKTYGGVFVAIINAPEGTKMIQLLDSLLVWTLIISSMFSKLKHAWTLLLLFLFNACFKRKCMHLLLIELIYGENVINSIFEFAED